MLKLTVLLLSTSLAFASPRSVVDGLWSASNVECSGGSIIPPQFVQMVKTTQMSFQDGVLTQSMTLMPNCAVTSIGNFQVLGNVLSLGPAKSTLSSTCPSGVTVKDKAAMQMLFSVEASSLKITMDSGNLCKTPTEKLNLTMSKANRYGR